MRFTNEQTQFIIDNHYRLKPNTIAKAIGVRSRQVSDKIKYLKAKGTIKNEGYCCDGQEYILEHYYKISAIEIGKQLGVSGPAIRKRASKLSKAGYIFQHNRSSVNYVPHHFPDRMETQRVVDGYPDVPWHMRQSTRRQYISIDMYARYNDNGNAHVRIDGDMGDKVG